MIRPLIWPALKFAVLAYFAFCLLKGMGAALGGAM